LGERDCWARGKKKCHGNGKDLVHKAWLLANRPFSEVNVFLSAAFRHLERPISVISDQMRILIRERMARVHPQAAAPLGSRSLLVNPVFTVKWSN
jgi:hypothetical protein